MYAPICQNFGQISIMHLLHVLQYVHDYFAIPNRYNWYRYNRYLLHRVRLRKVIAKGSPFIIGGGGGARALVWSISLYSQGRRKAFFISE